MGSRGWGGELRKIIKKLRGLGYIVEMTNSGHYHVLRPRDGQRIYTLPYSPSDPRGFLNCIRDLRKIIGVDLRHVR